MKMSLLVSVIVLSFNFNVFACEKVCSEKGQNGLGLYVLTDDATGEVESYGNLLYKNGEAVREEFLVDQINDSTLKVSILGQQSTHILHCK